MVPSRESDFRLLGFADFTRRKNCPTSSFLRQECWRGNSGSMGREEGEGVESEFETLNGRKSAE